MMLLSNALIKDGWVITADPFQLKFKDMNLTADLRAENYCLARRQNQQIIVEIKSFLGKSFAKEFQLALAISSLCQPDGGATIA